MRIPNADVPGLRNRHGHGLAQLQGWAGKELAQAAWNRLHRKTRLREDLHPLRLVLEDAGTLKRKTASLRQVPDSFRKMVLVNGAAVPWVDGDGLSSAMSRTYSCRAR